jgi:hypothetical protein
MSNRWKRWSLALAAAALVAVGGMSARTASAQQKEQCDEEQNADSSGANKSGKKNYRTVIGPDGRKVFVIEKAFVVCGKVPKPTVIYALQASTINYEWETLTQDFLPRVIEATRKAPF